MPVLAESLKIKNRKFEWGTRTYVMGILNVTPDSFSGDGLFGSGDRSAETLIERALLQARAFAASGVDILDVGGESTRPGAEQVGAEDEARRVLPVIRAIAQELDVLVSVDTYKADVAEAALQAGAHMVIDV